MPTPTRGLHRKKIGRIILGRTKENFSDEKRPKFFSMYPNIPFLTWTQSELGLKYETAAVVLWFRALGSGDRVLGFKSQPWQNSIFGWLFLLLPSLFPFLTTLCTLYPAMLVGTSYSVFFDSLWVKQKRPITENSLQHHLWGKHKYKSSVWGKEEKKYVTAMVVAQPVEL